MPANDIAINLEIWNGLPDDLKQVLQLSRKMVLDWGMSERYRNIAFGGQREQVFLGEQISQHREYSEDTAREIDCAVRQIVQAAFENAHHQLTRWRGQLEQGAKLLLAQETLSEQDLKGIQAALQRPGTDAKQEIVQGVAGA